MLPHLPGLVPVTGVEGGLAAAGLAGVEVDLCTKVFQQPDGRQSNLRIKLIDQTGDE